MRRLRRRYLLGPPGAMYITVTVLLSVGAINSQNNLLFFALGLALGGLLVSGLISGSSLMNVSVQRFPPVRGGVGEPLRIRYRVHNAGRLIPAFGLTIREEIAPPEKTLGAAPTCFAVKVGPGETIELESVVEPSARGVLHLGRLSVASGFPFGVLRKAVEFESKVALPIWPERLEDGGAALRRAVADLDFSETQRPQVGRGAEYLGVREYLPGDSARDIAWRPSARTGQLVVREHTRPAPNRLWIAVDLSDEQADAQANERAISIAAGAIERAVAKDSDVGLIVWPNGPVIAPMSASGAAGVRTKAALFDELAHIDLTQRASSTARIAPIPRGAALLVVHAAPAPRGPWPAGALRISASERLSVVPPESAAQREPALEGVA